MKIVLAILLLTLIPPVYYGEKKESLEPPTIFYEDLNNYPLHENDKIIDIEEGVTKYEGDVIKIK